MSPEYENLLNPGRSLVGALPITVARPRSERLFGTVEIVALMALHFSFAWGIGPTLATNPLSPLYAVGFALFMIHFVFVSPWLHGDSLKARGLGPAATAFVRTDNLGKAILRYGALSLGASALLIIGGLIHNPAMFEAVVWYSVAVKFIHYLFSATIQDALFFAFFLQRITGIVEGSANTRSSDLKRRALASGGGAFLFCIYHFPNPAIMAISLTFGGMMFWCYYRHPNLVAVVIAHAFTGTVMHRILQVPMRVGPFYKDPDGYIIRELFPIVGKLIGGLW